MFQNLGVATASISIEVRLNLFELTSNRLTIYKSNKLEKHQTGLNKFIELRHR